MGLLSDFIDSCFSVGKFQEDGVLLLPDNLIGPWSMMSGLKGYTIGGSYTFDFVGGVSISIPATNFNDQWNTEVDLDGAITLFEKATHDEVRYDFPDYDTFVKLPIEKKLEKVKLGESELRIGIGLIEQLPETLKNNEVTLNTDGQWKYVIELAWQVDEILKELNEIDQQVPDWLDEIKENRLKKNMITHLAEHLLPQLNLRKSTSENDKAKIEEVKNYAFYTWKLGFAKGREYDYLKTISLLGGGGSAVESRVEDYLAKSNMVKRRLIVCSNGLPSGTFFEKEDNDVLFTCEADMRKYNEIVPIEERIVFQPGHPQNGCTYVQHPFSSNVYYEVNSFHDSILERKQNELLRILESLGAYSAKVEIFHECQEASNMETEFHLDGNGSNGVISGSGSSNMTTGRSKEVLASQHATKDWQFNPPEKPELPQNLLFYPTEETWQQLATSVLRGGLKYAVVDLEYKTEYGITEKYLREVSASARAMIPSYEMNLKTNFASNLHRLTTTRWHYEVVFEDAKGKRAGGAPRSGSDNDGESNNKVEALFMKRARRYAQSDAHIDAEQRSDLEKFAQKYGIDDLRMEELIEEAFV